MPILKTIPTQPCRTVVLSYFLPKVAKSVDCAFFHIKRKPKRDEKRGGGG